MKEDLSKKSCLIIESGGYHSFALCLAEKFGTVYYYTPWKNAFPSMADAVVGSEWEDGEMLDTFDGLPLVRIKNMFDVVNEVDCIVCPDTYNGDLQEFFREQGKAVFGSFAGEDLELDRWLAREIFEEHKIDLSDAKRIVGIDALKKYLEKQKDKKWVKISSYRKEFETFAHKDWFNTEIKLDQLAYKLGPLKHITEFIVESDLPDMNETGFDGFFVDGEFPDKTLAGCEIKGVSYAGKIYNYKDLPEEVTAVNDGLKPILAKVKYQGAISSEIRSDGKKHYLLEPTCRLPSPPNELYQNMYLNLPEMVWEISNGRMPEIETKDKYGLELVLNTNWQDEQATHIPVSFDEKYRKNIKLKNPIKIDGNYYCLLINGISEVGSIVATGNDLQACKKEIEEVFDNFKYPNGCSEISHLDEAIEAFEKMEQKDKK